MAENLQKLDAELLAWADEFGRPFLGTDLTGALGPSMPAFDAAQWTRDAQVRGLLVVNDPEAGQELFELTDKGRARLASGSE